MIRKYLGKIIFVLLLSTPLLANIIFTQKVSKDIFYINETIKVTLELNVSNKDNLDEIYFEDYDTDEFWTTLFKKKIITKGKDFTTYRYEYFLEAKKEGLYTLNEQMIKISSQKIRKRKRRLKISSNSVFIKVLPLYNNIHIQGEHYTIKAKVDKVLINSNEAVNLTLKIKGKGNLKDIKKYKLLLKDQTVYTDAPIVKAVFKNIAFEGEFWQKFLIISNKSFTIPSFKLEYFNPTTRTVQTIQSEPIFIDLKSVKKKNTDPSYVKFIFLLFGLIFGGFVYKFFTFFKNKLKQKESLLEVKLKKARNDKELYQVLVQHNYNQQFDGVIESFELSIYKENKSTNLNNISKQCLDILKL